MLRLPVGTDGTAVDEEGGAPWRLPTSLAPASRPDGAPDVGLTWFEGGGSLRLRLQAPPSPYRLAPTTGGRMRIVSTTPTGTAAADWHPIGPRAADVVDVMLPLTPEETALARRVSEQGGSLVEIEVELDYLGRLPRLPWSATADPALVRAAVTPALGPGPFTVDAAISAFEALDSAIFRWSPNTAAAPPRNDALARPALAVALAQELLAPDPAGVTWRSDLAEPIRIDLEVSRIADRHWPVRWSFSSFYAGLTDPGLHFEAIERPVAFQTRSLRVSCGLPIGPEGVDTLTVEIDAGDVTGLTSVSFVAGGPMSVRVPFIHRNAAAPPRWRAHALVRGREGLVPHETAWADAPLLLIELTPATTGIHPLHLEGDPDTWALADRIEVVAGSRTAVLDAEHPATWLMFRQPPATVSARWVRGDRTVEATVPVREGAVRLTVAPLAPGEVVPVELVPGDTLLAEAAWVALAQGDRVETLEPAGVTRLGMRRSRLEEPEVRYRLLQMRHRPEGGVAPVETSDERIGRGTRVTL